MEWMFLLAGVALGSTVTWLLAVQVRRADAARAGLGTAQELAAAQATARADADRRAAAEARLAVVTEEAAALRQQLGSAAEKITGSRALLAEQQVFIEKSRKDLEAAFHSLAASALQGSSEQFLKLAEQRLATTRTQAVADLEERRKAVETLLTPLKETLGKLESRTSEIENARVGAYAKMDEQVASLFQATEKLQRETTTLSTALKSSQVRGRWGEMALRNVMDIAGMTEHCDYCQQQIVGDGRPDVIVNLPHGRRVAVDAKAPLDAYLEACSTTVESDRTAALKRHAAAVREHVKALASREYAASLGDGVELVVLFLPGDSLLTAAFESEPDLHEYALRQKVLLATPITLIALLRTLALYHQQEALAQNAQRIAETARELYERGAKFGEDLSRLRKGLLGAVEAFNAAVGSFEGRFLPMGKRLEDLKATSNAKRLLESPLPLEEAPRLVHGAANTGD